MNWDPVGGANAAVWLAIVLGLQVLIVLLYRWANGALPGLKPFLISALLSLAGAMIRVTVHPGADAWQSALAVVGGLALIVAPCFLYRAQHELQRRSESVVPLPMATLIVVAIYLFFARIGDHAARDLVVDAWRVVVLSLCAWQARFFRRVSERHPALPGVAAVASLLPAGGSVCHALRVMLDVFERSPRWLTMLTQPGSAAVFEAVTGTLLTFVFVAAATCAIRDRYLEQARAFADQAERDPLTNLINRRGLEQRLDRLAQTHHRTVGVLVVDVDHFKKINDRFGHLIGDQVLQKIALRLLATVRPGDFVCRFGGEEFVVVVPCREIDDVHAAAKRLRHAIGGEAFEAGDDAVSITISIGLAFGRLEDADLLLRDADERVLRAKHVGRNTIVLPNDEGPIRGFIATAEIEEQTDLFDWFDSDTDDLFGTHEAPV
ncbi:sensor domain-containing diguanylate cyclase [Pararobbsia silviterrae]|uniref:diguanylate cyclase n=1 Tax=Pararobbsia silviterrae TaxID=1792498 RepID=A0A494Y1Q4_9BURK|nr:GGDEF domain-containing protein [Pararobbsia silviterrae]RKP56637.1 GGDEF domain-containing protein [Pararobbsia silviterrae]